MISMKVSGLFFSFGIGIYIYVLEGEWSRRIHEEYVLLEY